MTRLLRRGYTNMLHAAQTHLQHDLQQPSPEFLYEILLQAYMQQECDNFLQVLEDFYNTYGETVNHVVAGHQAGAADYVADRDTLYAVPEVVMIAERAIMKPMLLSNAVRNTDFEHSVATMTVAFLRATLR